MSPSKRPARQDAAQRPVADLAQILHDYSGAAIDVPLLSRALTHRSYAYEHGGLPHNERQEFLGDSVLGVVVTDTLYRAHPDLPEGQLAKFRAAVVNTRALAQVARSISLGEFILLGRGELTTGGRDKDSILADATEAVIGTVYLCGGLSAADALIHRLMDGMMQASSEMGAGLDWKTSLQEIASAIGASPPEYGVEQEGPDHDKTFTATAIVDGERLGIGVGRNKKAAEQKAAEVAWRTLSERVTAASPDVPNPDASA